MIPRYAKRPALFMVLIALALSAAWSPARSGAEHPGTSVVFYVH